MRNVGGTRRIVVAGQSRNSYLTGNPNTKGEDVVLLITKPHNGDLENLELFGDKGSEGELRGNLDLHLSHKTSEKYPIVLANTMNSWPDYGIKNPYLIERYDSIKEWCHNYILENVATKYKFRKYPANELAIQTHTGEKELKGQAVELTQKILCEKMV